ncbi:hypothetical protein SASPL_148271 [Salvia splendens]|uniref:RING-type domain-containing protein n=1 Tax=Salvia splendens TaxID=180675 RepID=A0A8X8W908_SALSN|nr:hypothetical protein SASPL_148271 [Salvia splendens]
MLLDYRHCFHVMCMDAWLKLNASCPVCRSSPLPTLQSTSLQEPGGGAAVAVLRVSDGRRGQSRRKDKRRWISHSKDLSKEEDGRNGAVGKGVGAAEAAG